jgi:hypothetical protein
VIAWGVIMCRVLTRPAEVHIPGIETVSDACIGDSERR